MKVGIFGGSFDPIHLGHLLLAEYCREAAGLEQVRFIPAAQAPHKPAPAAAAKHRLEMVRLATWGHPHFLVDDVEIRRGGVSYTVDTLEALAAESPQDERFLLMGSDSLRDFGSWREPARICELATPLVVVRGGGPAPAWEALERWIGPERTEQVKRSAIRFPVVELSSTELRERASSGRSIRFQTPRAVEEYIRNHRLYLQDEVGTPAE